MKFLFLYRGGNAPQEKMEEYMKSWETWMTELTQKGVYKSGIPVSGGKVVTSTDVQDYQSSEGDVNGYSEIEAASIDEAVELAKGCPGLPYGGTIEVRTGMDM